MASAEKGVAILDAGRRRVNGQSKPDLFEHAFWVADAKISTALPYIVKGVFGRGDIVMFWGAPGSGKTFACMSLAVAVGSGQGWCGRRVRKGVVLYVAAESSRKHIENRIAALKIEWPSVAAAEVLIVPLTLDLLHDHKGDVDRVIATGHTLNHDIGNVALIIVDTLAVTFAGGDENSFADMSIYVENIKRIRAETGAAVLIVHHSGKDEARGPRGHSSLTGAVDAELAIETALDGKRLLRTGKVREGLSHTDLVAFTLRPIDLGQDEDGDAVTTCVLNTLDDFGTKRARRERKGAGLGKHQRAALRLLDEAGGRLPRIDLANRLKTEGIPRQRVNEAIATLLDNNIIVANNQADPPEVSLP